MKFDYDDANHNVESKEVEEGQLITDVPNKSKQSGYTLAKWMLNNADFDFDNTIITSDITLKAKYYCDSKTTELTMKHGWGDTHSRSDIPKYSPIVDVVITSRNGKNLDENSIIRQELSIYDVIPNKDSSIFRELTYDNHKLNFALRRNDNTIEVNKVKSNPAYETKYSILEVKRDDHRKNKYANWVDVISIYIDIDF